MLSHLVIKFESFDSEVFVRKLAKESPNGAILLWNYAGSIRFAQAPVTLRVKSGYRYFSPGHWSENRWIKWPRMLVTMMYLMCRVVVHEKVDVIFVGGGDILLWFAQILRKLGFAKRTMVTLEDWSVPNEQQSFYDRLNRIKIRINDFFLQRIDTRVIIFNQEIYDARRKYLGEAAVRNSTVLENQWTWNLEIKVSDYGALGRKHILILGTLRQHFGIEILFNLMPALHKKYGCMLKVIGPENDIYRHYKQMSENLGLEYCVLWRGFINNEDLPNELKDCAVGLNIQELPVNDSALTVAGRVVQYLQHLVVPVVSIYSGALTKVLQEKKLGLTCPPTESDLQSAVELALVEKNEFVRSITEFIGSKQSQSSALW